MTSTTSVTIARAGVEPESERNDGTTMSSNVMSTAETRQGTTKSIRASAHEVHGNEGGDEIASETSRKTVSTRSAKGHFTVMVVDDSARVRGMLRDALSAKGYQVIEAGNGTEALARYQPGMVDMVLLDLDMPVKNGWDAFEDLVKLNPGQPIILMTEQIGSLDLDAAALHSGVAEKPLDMITLMDTIKRTIGESREAHLARVNKQHHFTRFTRPSVSSFAAASTHMDNWGLND